MIRKCLTVLLVAALATLGSCGDNIKEKGSEERLVDLVNPFIGTGGEGWDVGNAFVGATAPFGMVKVGPDTTGDPGDIMFYHCSGYWGQDDIIKGFSHTHLHGTGLPDLGNILFMPTSNPMDEPVTNNSYWSHFDESSEIANPGYYSVDLTDNNVTVELTATERTASHRYTFSSSGSKEGYLVVNLGHTLVMGNVLDGGIKVYPDQMRLEGWLHNTNMLSNAYGGMPVYFSAYFNRPINSFGTWNNNQVFDAVAEQNGADIGAYLGFDLSRSSAVEVQVGVSFVSIEQARLNLEAETGGRDFDDIRTYVEEKWESELSIMRFEGGTNEQREIMATALYHAFLMPDIFTDVNGRYKGFDGKVRNAEDFIYYTDFSLWDTYRTLHPLLILVKPARQRDMVVSLVKMSEQGGYIPKWGMGIGYTNTMVGSAGDIVIAESYLKGLTDFGIETAYDSARRTATHAPDPDHDYKGRVGIQDYIELGFVPADIYTESVARTMEFSISDYAISNLATAISKPDDARMFAERAKNYRNLWDSESRFFRGKNSDGAWLEYFDPLDHELFKGPQYTEGNAWQYLWLVPHDVEGLVELFGSRDDMKGKLETFFESARNERLALSNGTKVSNIPPEYYWHGNEPGLHAAYLFARIGRPDLTQKWVRWIADTYYTTAQDGIPGNDDCGTLSAWYVFSALGFYPVPGSASYIIGSPVFTRVEIEMLNGTLIIEAPEASPENIYIQSAKLNGELLKVPGFSHKDIENGGTLYFEMGPQPSGWGVNMTP